VAVNADLPRLAAAAAAITGAELTADQLASFSKYLDLLVKWQKSQRLIGSSDRGWIVDNLFVDSLLFLKVLPTGFRTLVDVGSGAGIPGIPIKLARPASDVTLVESRARRVSFLSTVIRELGLQGIRVSHARLESIVQEAPAAFDAVVMRCAGDLAEVFPVAARLVAPQGVVVASGPPDRRALPLGDWLEIKAPGGRSRLFAVYRINP
jgi:16S rRNA (guanine527-N7)-methyltransferase